MVHIRFLAQLHGYIRNPLLLWKRWPWYLTACLCELLIGTLRSDNGGDASERIWIDFRSFKTFSPLYQVTQLLERRDVRLELKRGDRVRFQREKVKFISSLLLFSSQLKTWSFHVVVVQGRQRNVQKAWCKCRDVVLLIKLIAGFQCHTIQNRLK